MTTTLSAESAASLLTAIAAAALMLALAMFVMLFPVPSWSMDLFVRMSVVALPTSVSVAAGRVKVPDAAAVASMTVLPLVVPATASLPTAPTAP